MDAREISREVLAEDWSFADAMKVAEPAHVVSAIEQWRGAMVPMIRSDPKMEGADARATRDAIKMIGVKLEPAMSSNAAGAWASAVRLSLSKWPPRVAMQAAKQGIHESFPFGLRDVDARLHTLAAEINERHSRALFRLEQMQQAIERATNPQPTLEAKPFIWTEDEIADANATFEKAGIKTRYRLGEDGTCDVIQPTPDEREAERQRRIDEANEAS